MKKTNLVPRFFFFLAFFIISNLFSQSVAAQNAQQAQFSASIDLDTVALNDYLTLTLTFQNCEASGFELPELPNFQVVGRPSSQTSMSMINGKTTSSASYTYLLKPQKTGKFTLDKFALKTVDGKKLETEKIKVVVVEKYKNNLAKNRRQPKNVDKNLQAPVNPFGYFPPTPFEAVPPKPKRKTIQL